MPPVTGLILAEDAALKAHLQGFTVTDATAPLGGRPVEVWFRNPEAEERERQYPFIAIDLIDIAESVTGPRHMINRLKVRDLKYVPSDNPITAVEGSTVTADRPLPLDLDYQITANSRRALHDRALAVFLMRRFPGKWGALHVPGDDTARTMQVLGTTSDTTTDEYGKRLYRKIFTVRVASEMWATDLFRQVPNLMSLGFTLNLTNDPSLVISHLDCHAK